MKLNGWQRLWWVVVILTGIGTVFYVETKVIPDLPKIIKLKWIKEASEVMAPVSTDQDGKPVTARVIRNAYFYNYKTVDGVIAELEKPPTNKNKTKEEQIAMEEVMAINNFYRNELSDPENNKFNFYMGVTIVWVLGLLLLYILGSMIGWVMRGFKK